MSDIRIGDEVYIHGFVDEVRKDVVIIKNEGGYFGTVADEIMPSAQPEKRTEKRTETHACDCIERQAAIEIVDRYNKSHMILQGKPMLGAASIVIELEALPSAQPEIIHCKECKYGVQDEDKRWYCRGLGCQIGNEDGSGYCADAERRTDDSISD